MTRHTAQHSMHTKKLIMSRQDSAELMAGFLILKYFFFFVIKLFIKTLNGLTHSLSSYANGLEQIKFV